MLEGEVIEMVIARRKGDDIVLGFRSTTNHLKRILSQRLDGRRKGTDPCGRLRVFHPEDGDIRRFR